jgi:cytochrome c5
VTSGNKKSLFKSLTLAFSLVVGLLANSAIAAESSIEDEIRERIKPVGEVCVAGEDCGDIAAPAAAAPSGPRSGEDIYSSTCFGCHGTGAAGAPKVGDAAAWSARIGKGVDTLVNHAINGFNAMPPRGTCSGCSDEEIAATVKYMVNNSK